MSGRASGSSGAAGASAGMPVNGAAHARRFPRVVLWTVAVLAVVEFLQWTVVLPGDVQAVLGFHRTDLETGRWWTTLTFPLVHRDLTSLVLNAYAIALFGFRLEAAWGARRFLPFVVLSGLASWATLLLAGGTGVLLGASGAALATLAAYAMHWGRDVHGVAGGLPVRGRWLTAVVGGLIVLVGLRSGPGGGLMFLAHLGGLLTAWLFVRATPVLLVERLREGVAALPDEPGDDVPPRAIPKTSRQRPARETIDDAVSRSNAQAARRTTPKRRAKPEATPPAEPSIDAILDKISAQGMAQLTDDERRALEDHARRMRDR